MKMSCAFFEIYYFYNYYKTIIFIDNSSDIAGKENCWKIQFQLLILYCGITSRKAMHASENLTNFQIDNIYISYTGRNMEMRICASKSISSELRM